MTWYNPKDWFEKKDNQERLLICANPDCHTVITGNEIAYIPDFPELYHSGECAIMAMNRRIMDSNMISIIYVSEIKYITQKQARILLRQGKVEQPKDLEQALRN